MRYEEQGHLKHAKNTSDFCTHGRKISIDMPVK